MHATEEQEIIKRVLNGDTNAFGILVKTYQRPIFNLMYRMTNSNDEAAELTQEVFIKAYEKLEKFKLGKKFFPWLYALGLNIAKDYWRKKQRYCEVEVNNISNSKQIAREDKLETSYDYQKLQQALKNIPLLYREAIILRYHENMSLKDIADALQISLSAAKMRVKRGLEMLRKELKGGESYV
ncbi:MAG: sigma-70 family RNA polymerase sigma factor [Desulfonauticus sp.]|nr:sigma-70 family RNA polymerase sigma factor [Desulfonauticus sp.]